MDFRQIIQHIFKGDVPGHGFHGNQWIKGNGAFNPNPARGRGVAPRRGGNRRPAAVPQPRPAAAPKPFHPAPNPLREELRQRLLEEAKRPAEVAPKSPLPPNSAKILGEPDNFKALKTNEIAGDQKNFTLGAGGNQQKAVYTVTMEDGTRGIVKEIGYWPGISSEEMASNEILASKLGEAMNVPVRSALPVDGKPDSVVQAFVEGKTPAQLGCLDGKPFNSSRQMDGLSDDVKTQIGEIKFFNTLVGNRDDHYGNWIVNTDLTMKPWGDRASNAIAPDAKITGIDYSLAFGSRFPPYKADLVDARRDWGVPLERINGMMDGVDRLLASGTLNPVETSKIQTIADQLYGAFGKVRR